MIFNYVLLVLIFASAPALVLWLCRKVPVLDKIGPILILYILGAAIGNLGAVGIRLCPDEMPEVQTALSNITVPLAIPLLLFQCVFRKSETRGQVYSMISGLVAVVIAIVIGYLIFGEKITSPDDPQYGARIGGMLTGSYTGGTVNMASLQKMLGVPEEAFVLANTFDMMVCFCYLMFLVSVGVGMFRRILPHHQTAFTDSDNADIQRRVSEQKENSHRTIFSRGGIVSSLKSLLAAVVITAVSLFFAKWVCRFAGEGNFMMIFILSLTTLGIAGSFLRPIRTLEHSSDIGMYFIYIFSMTVASMADLSKIDFSGSAYMLGYITVIVFGSLLLHTIFAALLKVDADTMVITSVAYINSPPFVPMVAAAMKNKDVLLPGLTIGIIGYALGNYLGLFVFKLLCLL